MSWERTAKDAGTQTRTVLRSRRKTAAELTAVAAELHRENGLTAGNGSLMRTAPVALALLGDPHATAKAARAVSAITHYDPDAGDACVLWCAAIQHAILDGEFDVAAGLHLLSLERRNSWELRIIEAQENDPTAFRWNGWVVHAFQAAWSLIHRTAAHDPSEHVRGVLEGAARLAGDTDTVGAIAGALVGARWGASAVPAQWREVLHGWPGLTGHDLARRGAALGELGSRCSLVGTLR
jgi:ADP-ribosylglycohydrolase